MKEMYRETSVDPTYCGTLKIVYLEVSDSRLIIEVVWYGMRTRQVSVKDTSYCVTLSRKKGYHIHTLFTEKFMFPTAPVRSVYELNNAPV